MPFSHMFCVPLLVSRVELGAVVMMTVGSLCGSLVLLRYQWAHRMISQSCQEAWCRSGDGGLSVCWSLVLL